MSQQAVQFGCLSGTALDEQSEWWRIYSFPSTEREPLPMIRKSLQMGSGVAAHAVCQERTVGIAMLHILRDLPLGFLV